MLRRDTAVESIGKMAELPADITPLQIGTTGSHKGVHFALIGRVRMAWDDGNWNEWCMMRDDGSRAWLAEAQGSLAINAEAAGEDLPRITPALGSAFTFESVKYKVTDIKNVSIVACEGELPYIAKSGTKRNSVDLTGPKGAFASLEYEAAETPRLFIGQYASFNELKFSNLRELPGWDIRDAGKAGA